MKEAIAIINVPDDVDIDELCITFDLERMLNQDGDVETIWGGISEPLRPLPTKEKVKETGDFITVNRAWQEGFNACLENIIGDNYDE